MTHPPGPLALLRRQRLLPVLTEVAPGFEAEAIDVLVGGGLAVVEITLRTPGAVDRLAALAADPRACVGAGTVLRPAQVDLVHDAGARFVVSPGFDPDVVERCCALGLPVMPGAGSATDVMAALRHGLDTVKLFPARQLGGPAFVQALAAAFVDVAFLPSGGLSAADAGHYLALPQVLAVSGSWATPSGALHRGDAAALATAVREARAHLDRDAA